MTGVTDLMFWYFCWFPAVFLKWTDSSAEFFLQCFDSPVFFLSCFLQKMLKILIYFLGEEEWINGSDQPGREEKTGGTL